MYFDLQNQITCNKVVEIHELAGSYLTVQDFVFHAGFTPLSYSIKPNILVNFQLYWNFEDFQILVPGRVLFIFGCLCCQNKS